MLRTEAKPKGRQPTPRSCAPLCKVEIHSDKEGMKLKQGKVAPLDPTAEQRASQKSEQYWNRNPEGGLHVEQEETHCEEYCCNKNPARGSYSGDLPLVQKPRCEPKCGALPRMLEMPELRPEMMSQGKKSGEGGSQRDVIAPNRRHRDWPNGKKPSWTPCPKR